MTMNNRSDETKSQIQESVFGYFLEFDVNFLLNNEFYNVTVKIICHSYQIY